MTIRKLEIKKISCEYKNNPETGLSKIEQICETHEFTREEIKKLVSEFIKVESSEFVNVNPPFYNKKDDGTLEIVKKIKPGSFDEYIYELLKYLDQGFLKNLYLHLGGNPYYFK